MNANRGRPRTFGPAERAYLADLIRQHGIRRTRQISPLPICNATLQGIAREHGIVLERGRRRVNED